MSIEINQQFEQALELLKDSSKSLFITGKAGSGKSTLLDYYNQKSGKNAVLLAPTGVAALNIKGQTIHNFFNFYIDVTVEKILSKKMKPKSPKLYKIIKTIIIDEISMVRADIMDCIDTFLRMYGPDAKQAFGGVQMVLVGDLYQLPPVVNASEMDIFSKHYESPYFFSAKVFNNFSMEIIELEKIYRQKDQEFVDLLNRIRNNSVQDSDIKHLNKRYLPDFSPKTDEFYISLTTTNKRADEINEEHLAKLSGRIHRYDALVSGNFGAEYYPTAHSLQFKVGSQVMMLNNDHKKRYVNGSMGVIEAIKTINDQETLSIRLQDGDRIANVTQFVWEVVRFKIEDQEIISEPVGTFSQFPIRLAWAVTIHKSQGKTFERVILDIGKNTFAAGQIYVGLSRATSFEGIVLKTPIYKHHIRSDARIYKFMTAYQYKKSAKLQNAGEKIILIKAAIEQNFFLQLTYLKANDSKFVHTIKPLTFGMQNYQGKLFPALQAICKLSNEKQTFHMGRILEIRQVS